jgi:DNA-directed RNA polymerase subunit K/omega
MDKAEIEEIGSIVDSDVESNDSDVESVILKDEFDIEDLDDEKIGDDDDEDDEKKEMEDDANDSDDISLDSDNRGNTIVGGDDFSDDEDEDEDYLQKMDKKMKQTIVDTYHHELKIHNADEIDVACTVARNEDGFIVDPLHRTLPFVTVYEKSRILGERAKQIEAGAHPFVELEENIIDSYLIALREYHAKKIPFIIQRPLPNGVSEYWKLSDLELLE